METSVVNSSNSEPIVDSDTINKVKDKENLSDVEIVTNDIKTRLYLLKNSTDQRPAETKQLNGLRQLNGRTESSSSESKSFVDNTQNVQSKNTEANHVNEKCTEAQDLPKSTTGEIEYVSYTSELQMPDIMKLIQKDLSEPYSIYTYRYFIHNWPKLCFLAMDGKECIGAIVCKLDIHRKITKRGYIAMLAVDIKYRKRKIGSNLVRRAIKAMIDDNADEIVLETEITNQPALKLYENLGFVRDKRLFRYYLNGVDALRLKLWLR
ncbi:N-alpha-acetyltransferase 30 [Trichogramma pretiosum]|uniref:N-alpha-acetyltransferase 30 n=1 Tax=Trichogramma pretiosum TaxID=7493 RepID=UPI0006C95C44|nr:N-alpha-acetyltransferase 30 [Trichogramma pretiosum]XP_014235940.1 N-alpha-acetyltransferase 30 [Trichogramma pretiosum]